jgi:outer membrane protein OmpA-like peptidoglycan-associated protein
MLKQLSLLSLPVVLVTAACSSATPPNLVDARAAYQRASHGPAAQLTPAQLHVAETSLAAAERTYEDEGDSANTRDRAYVAQRKAELAETQASIVASDRNTQLAARRVAASNAEKQAATQLDLNSTKNQLAGERSVVANQTVALAGEKQRRQDAERRAADAMAALTEIASVKKEPRGTVITLSGSVIFASGKADLLPGAQAKLDQVAIALAEGDPEAKILIEGHTDSRGSDALNQELSTRRAAAVRSYLVSKGLAPERVVSQGLGPSRPIADNETAEGRANNRRVELVVQARQ